MKFLFLIFYLAVVTDASSQTQINSSAKNKYIPPKRWLSINPLGFAEPQAAVGIGFSNRLSARSAYFTELSYIINSPFYNYQQNNLRGYRWLFQYRHLNKSNPNNFIGLEFRLKGYQFNGKHQFINSSSNDTLINFNYNANATSVGGAFLLGSNFSISSNKKWKIEITAGAGAKHKFVRFKNLPEGYKITPDNKGFGLKPPEIYEAVGMPYFPVCARITYELY